MTLNVLFLKFALFSFRGPQSKILKETFLSVTSEQECMDKFGQITTRVTIDKNKVCAVDRAGQSDACQVLAVLNFKDAHYLCHIDLYLTKLINRRETQVVH